MRKDVASFGLDKDRAAQKLMQNLQDLVSPQTYEYVQACVSHSCGETPDRYVMCVMKEINKIDRCLARRCVMRIKAGDPQTLAATKRCICGQPENDDGCGAASSSASRDILRTGQKRGVDAMGGSWNSAFSTFRGAVIKSRKQSDFDSCGGVRPSGACGSSCSSGSCGSDTSHLNAVTQVCTSPIASAVTLSTNISEDTKSEDEITSNESSASAVSEPLLAELKINVNKPQAHGMTPLMLAAQKGTPEAIKILIKHGADLEIKDSMGGRTALMWAVSSNKLDAAQTLVEAGADIECVANDGSNPLLSCARGGFTSIARFLIHEGAKLDVRDSCGFTPLMFAASFGKTEIVILLAQKMPSLLDAKDRRGCTPLILAARSGRCDTALALAEVGCNVASTCEHGNNALHHAARNGHTTTLRALLSSSSASKSRNELIHARSKLGYTPLLAAAEAGRTECVSVLLEHGARVQDKNDHGLDAVQLARLEGHNETARVLLRGAMLPAHS